MAELSDSEWNDLSWVRMGTNRKSVLLRLYEVDEPRTATDLKKSTGVERPHVSKILRDMLRDEEDPWLVQPINPEAPHNVHYRLTERGERIAEKIKEVENQN